MLEREETQSEQQCYRSTQSHSPASCVSGDALKSSASMPCVTVLWYYGVRLSQKIAFSANEIAVRSVSLWSD